MRRLVEFPLEGGGTVLVQVDGAAIGPVTRGTGDQVVTDGQFLLSPGARVEIKDANQTAGDKADRKQGGGGKRGRTDRAKADEKGSAS